MSIVYFSGNPGAGKTSGMIDYVLSESQYEGKPIYFIGIRECSIDDWTEITPEQLDNWHEFPHGSVFVVDELQDYWPARTNKSQPIPDTLKKLAKLRHGAYQFVCNSQYPRQVDMAFRNLVNRHYHLERQFGMKWLIRRFQFEKICHDPVNDYHARKDALTAQVKLKKHIFSKYHSTVEDTQKPKPPLKLFIVGALALYCAYSAYTIKDRIFGDNEARLAEKEAQQQIDLDSIPRDRLAPPSSSGSPFSQTNPMFESTETFTKHITPLIPNYPASAPIYAHLHTPVSMPKPNCLKRHSEPVQCTCYSQQGTKMAIDKKTCLYYVANGYQFDYTRFDSSPSLPVRRKTQSEADEGTSSPRFRVVRSSGRPQYPTARNSFRGTR